MLKFKEAVKRLKPVRVAYEKTKIAFFATLYNISPFLLVSYHYYKARQKKLVLDNPVTFEDKLIWLMLYWNHPLKTVCADKYACRDYVKALGLEHLLPPLYGVYQNSRQINFKTLPNRFVLKCTRGSRFNVICKDKKHLDLLQTRKLLSEWQRTKFHKIYGEIHYANIKPLIICEAFLGDDYGNPPVDYKMFCFRGQVHCTMVCSGRYTDNPHFDYFDYNWEKRLPYGRKGSPESQTIPPPLAYQAMVKAAEKLSRPFPFVRIDFYDVNGQAYFGEMTFTPNGCIDTGLTDEAQKTLGELIVLPEVKI
ncbi:MAG: glycosyl transferase [Candidatus Aminicenantes bacterium]|nr:glycosyl transferase [Candidatus Aminicenantes bacterium]